MGKIAELTERYREVILYVLFGGFTTLVNLGAYTVFSSDKLLAMDPNISNALSWVVSVTFAFVTNKWFVFNSKDLGRRKVLTEAIEFYGARIFTFIVSVVMFYLLHDVLGETYGVAIFTSVFLGISPGFFTKIITSCTEIVLNWVLSKYWVFKKVELTE